MISQKAHSGTHRMDDVWKMGNRESTDRYNSTSRRVQSDDDANIQFTSGTTGNPKGATLTHSNIVNNGYFHGRRLQYHEHKVDSSDHLKYRKYIRQTEGFLSLVTGHKIVLPCPTVSLLRLRVGIHGCDGSRCLHGDPSGTIRP